MKRGQFKRAEGERKGASAKRRELCGNYKDSGQTILPSDIRAIQIHSLPRRT
jgi:hypothetical protein